LLLSSTFSGHPSLAQDSITNTLPPNPLQRKRPFDASASLARERQAAWEQATPEQRKMAEQMFQDMLTKAKRNAGRKLGRDETSATRMTVPFTDQDGKQQMRPATLSNKGLLQSGLSIPPIFNLKPDTGRDFESDSVMFSHARATRKGKLAAVSAPAMQEGCYKSIEQFIRDTYQGVVLRQPYADEFNYWNNLLVQAQTQGVSQLVTQAQDVGRTLFHSQEYYNRYRGDSDYVYDLYKGFLHRDPEPPGWAAWLNILPNVGRDAVLEGFTYSPEFYNHASTLCSAATYDADSDGLPNDFENRVADAFTPYYHVSTGEPDNFATFADMPQLAVSQSFNPYVPPSPVSNFRVTPYNIGYFNGQLIGILRVDYLTFWDRDSGLAGGGSCYAAPFGLDFFLSGLFAHDNDFERSAVLIAAPIVNNTYNLDPNAYSLYYMYTTAHEFTFTEQINYLDFSASPAPAGLHVGLALTRSKHGTYPFDPDYLPLIPWWVIFDVYAQIDNYCNCYFDPYCYYDINRLIYCNLLYFTADRFFFSCVVERWTDAGGRLAGLRFNVGELNNPINRSHFIQGPEITTQFNTPFFR
jgi:hypothetical protein